MEINSGTTCRCRSAIRCPADGYDFQSIITHETGHFLGMAHSGDDRATMFAQLHAGLDLRCGPCRPTTRPASARSTCPDGDRAVDPSVAPDGSGIVAEDACDPTPAPRLPERLRPVAGLRAVSRRRGRAAGRRRGAASRRLARRRGGGAPSSEGRADVVAHARHEPVVRRRCAASWPAKTSSATWSAIAAGAPARLAVDVEASGMFAYRARTCTVQLAWDDGEQVAVVDTLATSIAPLGELLGRRTDRSRSCTTSRSTRACSPRAGSRSPTSTTRPSRRGCSRAWRPGWPRSSTSELGVHIGKAMQQHDWRVRPLDERMLDYLAADVVHLEALEQKALDARSASAASRTPCSRRRATGSPPRSAAARSPRGRAAYARVKGAASPRRARARRAAGRWPSSASARPSAATCRRTGSSATTRSSPSRARVPRRRGTCARVRGVPSAAPRRARSSRPWRVASRRRGRQIPDEERALFERPQVPAAEARARREREMRLIAWRRAEAKRRGVDEQVVLPGHCASNTACLCIYWLRRIAINASVADGLRSLCGRPEHLARSSLRCDAAS